MTNTNYPSATPNPQPRGSNNKSIVIGVLAAALLGTWGYWLYKNNQSAQEITSHQTKETAYMSARDSVQMLYNDALSRLDSITGTNNNLQGQLSDRNSEIAKLKSQINGILKNRNATKAELAKAKDLINELNTKIETLEADNARLTGENQQLTSANTQLTAEKSTLETNLQTTTAEKDELASTVDVASTFSASNFKITPIKEKRNGKEKTTTTAKRVDKLVLDFDVENRIAKTGPADLYVIVTAPDGKVISDPSLNSGTFTTRTEGDKTYTNKVSVDYEQGTRKAVSIPIRQNDFQTGDYKIEVYNNGFKIGEGVRTLKKGGLFG
jgi:multidrug efflux pump subunit AcrA (membrane-fusion protein)